MNVNELMNELPPAPADVVSWIEDECVQKTYIFYSRKKRKAVCSRCGAEYELDRDGCCEELEGEHMKHDKKLICTACWHDAIAKADGISCANLNEYFRVVIFVKKNSSLYASLSEVIVDFANQRPNISKAFTALYKFNKHEQIYYKHRNWYGWTNMSHDIKLPSSTSSMSWQPKFENTYLYDRNFNNVFDIPALKYADVKDVYRDHNLTACGVMAYIPLAMKYRSLELLRKAGYKKIFKEKIIGTGFSRACNWRATSIEKILRVKTKGEAKAIREANLSLEDLLTYQKHCKEQGNCPLEYIPILVEFERRDYAGNHSAIIETYMDIISAAGYVVNQNEKLQTNQEKDRLSRVTLMDYADYLRECEKLGYNMTKKHTLKPKDLLTAHQRTSKIFAEKKDRITAAEFKRSIERITGMEKPFIRDDLLIRPAASAAELRAEGEALGHCVGGYADRVWKGICAILFIRKTDSPEDPFYTLELNSKGKVVQCRGKSNRDMTEAVKAFVDVWFKEVVRRYYQNMKKQKAA